MNRETMLAHFHKNNFLVIGRAGLDLYADPPGSEIENAQHFTAALGGSAANIAVAIAKQGGAVALVTAVSDDAVGRYTLKAIKNYNIDARFVRKVSGEARNSLAVVETRAVNCQSVIYRNGAADFQMHVSDFDGIVWSAYSTVIVTGTALAVEPSRSATFYAIAKARDAGLPVVLDIDYRPYSWQSKAEAQTVCSDAVSFCDIVVGNDEEFAVLAGDKDGFAHAEDLAKHQHRLVVYKMGAAGCITFAHDGRFDTPIFPVTALKPTGAGDAFMGGFISGLVQAATLPEAVRRGAATAAIVVTRVGCAPAMPDANEVEIFLCNASV
jgi:5-dehydro-2-deoxygluconokinase